MEDVDLDGAVFLALGSNLRGAWSSSIKVLEDAVGRFGSIGLNVVDRSSWWRSKAWPDPADPDYINAVALVETTLKPQAVLGVLHELEAAFGRARRGVNAARVLDLDLIAFGRCVIMSEDLVLPHPRAEERAFVMGPLAEIAPTWRHPVSGVTAQILAAKAQVGRDAAPC